MGQHFLASRATLDAIVTAASIKKNDVVLEVGPGKGILTAELALRAKKIIAIEKDSRFIPLLQDQFPEKNVSIIEGDILHMTLGNVLPKKYKIVANIPYYITSHFLRLFLESDHKPESMTLLVQYEVAKRMCATPPNMNMLALSVQAYGTPRIIQKVPRSHFKPAPDVDSAIITITNISNDFFEKNEIPSDAFFALAKKAFGQKRKKLRNTIGIDSDQRPQELSLEHWVKLFNMHRNHT